MARARALGDLRADVIDRANIESATGVTAMFSAARINEYINQSAARLYNKLVVARGHEYYLASNDFTTQNGVDTYALPVGFFELLGVDVHRGGAPFSCLPYNFLARNRYKAAQVTSWDSIEGPVYYRLRGDNIHFIPAPSGSLRCTVFYIPATTRMVADNDTFDGINGWEEWVVCDAAAKVLRKQGLDASEHIQAREDIGREIEALASHRDAGNPETVTDVDDAGPWWRRS